MSQHYVHTEAGHQADDALRDGQGLAVGGRIGPGHSDLLALQILHAAELVDHVEHIRHTLGRVVHIALEVHQRGPLLQNAVPVAFIQGIHKGFLIFVTLTDEHIVPDADDVRHEGHHVGGFPNGLAVGDLRLLFVQILNLQTQQITGGGKGEAGAGGVIPEDGDTQTGIKDPGGLIPLPEIPQRIGYGEDGLQFLIGLVPSPIKVGLIHIVDVQTL